MPEKQKPIEYPPCWNCGCTLRRRVGTLRGENVKICSNCNLPTNFASLMFFEQRGEELWEGTTMKKIRNGMLEKGAPPDET